LTVPINMATHEDKKTKLYQEKHLHFYNSNNDRIQNCSVTEHHLYSGSWNYGLMIFDSIVTGNEQYTRFDQVTIIQCIYRPSQLTWQHMKIKKQNSTKKNIFIFPIVNTNIISTGPNHNPWTVCISSYCPLYQ
jgi:hypothetical protein